MKQQLKISLTLAVVCAIAAASLAAVNQVTQKAIAINSIKELQESLKIVYPIADRFELEEMPVQEVSSDSKSHDFAIIDQYQAYQGDRKIGKVYRVSSKGYGGQIVLLIAISTQTNTMVGMRVLEHQETPGLGSEITSSHFQEQFHDKPLSDSFELNRDIQALSGATISSRAVIRACQGVLTELGKEADQ